VGQHQGNNVIELGEDFNTLWTGDADLRLYITTAELVTQICVFNTVKLGTYASSP
jgi:hypothetical protein